MEVYEPDLFFNVNNLNKETRLEILKDSLDKCYKWHLDQRSEGKFRRETIKATKEDVIDYYKKDNSLDIFSVIRRRGYHDQKDSLYFDTSWCGEIGYRISDKTYKNKDLFSFIYLTEDELYGIVEKYKLRPA